jgi:hypothetical protein
VKVAALLLVAAGLLTPADREGNFTIRFEPKAVLQTGVAIPFEISVSDNRHQPVAQATVKLSIEKADQSNQQVFRAPSVSAGVYLAKPIFREAGNWSVNVEVRRSDQLTSRTLEFSVHD